MKLKLILLLFVMLFFIAFNMTMAKSNERIEDEGVFKQEDVRYSRSSPRMRTDFTSFNNKKYSEFLTKCANDCRGKYNPSSSLDQFDKCYNTCTRK